MCTCQVFAAEAAAAKAFAAEIAAATAADSAANAATAAAVDWTTKKAVTPVKNQGQCGSCWAFSTTGSVEGINAIKTGKLISLSEEELISCSTNGNMGCNGGLMDNGFEWIVNNRGINTEDGWEYVAKEEKCGFFRRHHRRLQGRALQRRGLAHEGCLPAARVRGHRG